MTKLIQVAYTVPVLCSVDLDTSEIREIIVIDEEIQLAEGEFFDDEGQTLEPNSDTARALEIAETKTWPAWRLGD